MIKEIENRRSIRKYKRHEISKEIIEDIIYSTTLAPSAKNRQPWKFIVYQGEEKSKLVDVMHQGIKSEKITHKLMPEWAFAIPDAENTVRVMEEAPCLIAVLNTNQKTPFDSIEDEKRIVEICDSLSIGAAIENHYTVDLTDRFDQSIRIKLHNNGNRENFHFFHWKSTGNF